MKKLTNPELTSLKSTHLPILPAGVIELISIFSDENTPFNEISTILGRFPSITARLIILANSAWSSPSGPVENLTTACSRLGFNLIRSVSIALSVGSPFSVRNCPEFNISKFWCRSLLTADIAAQLSVIMNKEHLKETARTAGLLHNLGLLWLADRLPDAVQKVFIQYQNQDQDEQQRSILDICQETIGVNYAEAGAFLALEWGLPDVLADAMYYHHTLDNESEKEITEIVAIAVAVAKITEKSNPEDEPDFFSAIPESVFPIEAGFVDFAYEMLEKNRALSLALFNS